MGDPQTGLGDEPVDWPVQVTAAADNILKGIQPILPGGDGSIVASAMFEKQQGAFRLEDACDLPQSLYRVRNRTECPGADDPIELPIGIRQEFGRDLRGSDRKRDRRDSLTDPLGKKISRIHGGEV